MKSLQDKPHAINIGCRYGIYLEYKKNDEVGKLANYKKEMFILPPSKRSMQPFVSYTIAVQPGQTAYYLSSLNTLA